MSLKPQSLNGHSEQRKRQKSPSNWFMYVVLMMAVGMALLVNGGYRKGEAPSQQGPGQYAQPRVG